MEKATVTIVGVPPQPLHPIHPSRQRRLLRLSMAKTRSPGLCLETYPNMEFKGLKDEIGKYPAVVVDKIKSGEIKEDYYLLNDDGLAKNAYPNNWKGTNGLYCAGLARMELLLMPKI
ncbi:hypothetical protein SASPL_120051 [Salvia splendens]|uniref:Uncharacterized protein n=1 Tax=Salvia splendens TaxID=180675 RepID=A0A8X8XUP1_SALSN|nr:hypothetical protein SASPL_120051 [Salvia splendens]